VTIATLPSSGFAAPAMLSSASFTEVSTPPPARSTREGQLMPSAAGQQEDQ
jgi:hypothetical protein